MERFKKEENTKKIEFEIERAKIDEE